MATKQKKKLLVAGIMGKNEIASIPRTLDSIRGLVDGVVFEDTGSTDGTQVYVRVWCKENNMPLVLFESPMVDFSTSRNRLLDALDEETQFALLLDCNDELRNGNDLRSWCKRRAKALKYKHVKHCNDASISAEDLEAAKRDTGLYYVYYNLEPGFNVYPATRLLRSKSGWRYVGRSQESLNKLVDGVAVYPSDYVLDSKGRDVILYQERSKDAVRSIERMKTRDIAWLEQDIAEGIAVARSYFYIGQTWRDIANSLCGPDPDLKIQRTEALKKSIEGYTKRLDYPDDATVEEITMALFEIGKAYIQLELPERDVVFALTTSWRYSCDIGRERAEPLVELANYYRLAEIQSKGKFRGYHNMCAAAASAACKITPQPGALFLDKLAYSYHRWHYLSVVGFYVPAYQEEGYKACIEAVKTGIDAERNKANLKLYVKLRMEKQKAAMKV